MIKLGNEESINFSAEFELDPKAIEQLHRDQMEVMGKGEYNAYALKRDGYLSPDNCWKSSGRMIDLDSYDFTTEDLEEVYKDYWRRHFMLSPNHMNSSGYIMSCHIEEFMEFYNEFPEIHMNFKTTKAFAFSVLSLTGAEQVNWLKDEPDGVTGNFKGCKIVIDNELCDYEVALE